jgi:hypothetical protein
VESSLGENIVADDLIEQRHCKPRVIWPGRPATTTGVTNSFRISVVLGISTTAASPARNVLAACKVAACESGRASRQSVIALRNPDHDSASIGIGHPICRSAGFFSPEFPVSLVMKDIFRGRHGETLR